MAGQMRRAPHYQRALPFSLAGAPNREASLRDVWAQLHDAAAGGSPEAALVLGSLLWSTTGQEHEGVQWLRVALEAGEAEAYHLLGLAHFRGRGVEQDLVHACRLQRAAAERGVVAAQFELSLLLDQGLGGPVDRRGAKHWESKAEEGGHGRACLNRGVRATRGRPANFYEAAQMVRTRRGRQQRGSGGETMPDVPREPDCIPR